MKGYIHSFESLATLDGAGVRYGVFMQGCPLKCAYCHNPDTWSGTGAMVFEAKELVEKVGRYKPYFKNGGGVTFSGGEPLLQAEFIRECIPYFNERKINYIIDTSGAVKLTECVKDVVCHAQSVILDLKFWDDESYVRYTGKDMSETIELLKFLDSVGKPVLLRTVIIPGINDTKEVMEKYLVHLKDIKCIEKYELLAFHTMGFFKYEKLGIQNPFEQKTALEGAVREKLQKFVDEKLADGICADIVNANQIR